MSYRYPNGRILVFAKAPIPGQCKTRMQPFLTPEESSQLQQALTWQTLQTACHAQLAPVELYCTPDTLHPFHRHCLTEHHLTLSQQSDGTLGERMHQAFCQSLTSSEFAIIIGVDCPSIDAQYLNHALKALCDNIDCVIGPACDGGYVLIGLRQAQAILFEQINWGSEFVLQQTIEKINALKLSWEPMQVHSDIDTAKDLQHILLNEAHPLHLALPQSIKLKPLNSIQ